MKTITLVHSDKCPFCGTPHIQIHENTVCMECEQSLEWCGPDDWTKFDAELRVIEGHPVFGDYLQVTSEEDYFDDLRDQLDVWRDANGYEGFGIFYNDIKLFDETVNA